MASNVRFVVRRGDAKTAHSASKVVRHFWHIYDKVTKQRLEYTFASRDEARANLPGKRKVPLDYQPPAAA